MNQLDRSTAFVGHAVFAVLALLALHFWQERTLLLDAAFQSYLFVAEGAPAIMVERFGAAAVQFLPLLGVCFGAALPTVLKLYSVSVVLLHHVLFSVCLHGLRDGPMARCVLIFNVLLVGDCFYWMQNELLQAISLLFLLLALARFPVATGCQNLTKKLALTGLAATVAYLHPLVFFPLAFVWLWFWLRPGEPFSRRFLLAAAGVFALVFGSKYVFRQPNFYDRGMTGQFVREFDFSLDKLFDGPGFRDFSAHLTGTFGFWLPSLALALGLLVWRRRWCSALLVALFSGGYWVLIEQRFRDDERWYIAESHLQALAVFVAVPLVFECWTMLAPRRRFWLVLLFFLLTIRVLQIFKTHESYTARLAYVRGLLDKTRDLPARKFVLPEQGLDQKTLMMTWGLPFETLQMSALAGPDSVRVLAVAADARAFAARWPADTMVSFLEIRPRAFADWPAGFYRMADTASWRVLAK